MDIEIIAWLVGITLYLAVIVLIAKALGMNRDMDYERGEDEPTRETAQREG